MYVGDGQWMLSDPLESRPKHWSEAVLPLFLLRAECNVLDAPRG